MERKAEIINQIVGLLISMYLLWLMIPEHRRRLYMMKSLHTLKQTTHTAAQQCAAMGMKIDLAKERHNKEDHRYTNWAYDTTYYLMTTTTAHVNKCYEKLRGTS